MCAVYAQIHKEYSVPAVAVIVIVIAHENPFDYSSQHVGPRKIDNT